MENNCGRKMTRVNFLGDLYLNGSNKNFEYILDNFKSKFNQEKEDINFLNLEAPVTTNISSKDNSKCSIINEKKSLIKLFESLNINLVGLANNHIFDFKEKGFNDTANFLSFNNINYFGAGNNLKNARTLKVLEKNNIKFGFLGYSWDFIQTKYATTLEGGVAPLIESIIISDIKKAKKEVDFLIISFHWGYEREIYPMPSQRELAHKSIDNGADLIIGHHSHVPQGFEKYKNKLIVYSLGNFYFDHFKDEKFNLIQTDERRQGMHLSIQVKDNLTYNSEIIYFSHDFKKCIISENKDFLSKPLLLTNNEYNRFWEINRIRADYPDMYNIKKKYKFISKVYLKIWRLKYRILIKLKELIKNKTNE